LLFVLLAGLQKQPALRRSLRVTDEGDRDMTGPQSEWLAERFEEHRTHLRAIGYRMLGSLTEADDAVQETWLRLNRSDTRTIENLGGWLTTAVARVGLDRIEYVRVVLTHPGYPLHLLLILGIWKVPCGVVLLRPVRSGLRNGPTGAPTF
jgi:Sigma-70 region 2